MTVQTDPMPGESTAWSGWNPEVLKQNNDCFEGRPPEELLRWDWKHLCQALPWPPPWDRRTSS